MTRKRAFRLIEPFGFAHGKPLAVRKRERPAFTLIELLIVIAIVAVLLTILVPVIIGSISGGETAVCKRNLGAIGKKYNDYAHDTRYEDVPFPRHVTSSGGHIVGNANLIDGVGLRGGSTLDTAAATGIGLCGMQTVWVLISKGYFPASAFKCPGDADYEARTASQLYGWTDPRQFSYGIHFPYDGKSAPADNPADLMRRRSNRRFIYKENMVLFADRNPGGAVDGTTRTHSNHGEDDGGVIVVSRIGNTTFHQSATDSKAGFGDNIYTDALTGEGAAGVDEFPQTVEDTVITPAISR